MAVFWLSRTEIQSPSGTFTGVAYITSVIIFFFFIMLAVHSGYYRS